MTVCINSTHFENFWEETGANLLQYEVIEGVQRCHSYPEGRAGRARHPAVTHSLTILTDTWLLITIIITTHRTLSPAPIFSIPVPSAHLRVGTPHVTARLGRLVQVCEALRYLQYLAWLPPLVPAPATLLRTLVLHYSWSCYNRVRLSCFEHSVPDQVSSTTQELCSTSNIFDKNADTLSDGIRKYAK